MKRDFTVTLLVDESPRQVFNAVLNVKGWWNGFHSEDITGETSALDDEFSFRAGGGAHYSRQRLVEVVPDKRIVWLVTESGLTFIDRQDEWNGTKIIFEISRIGDKTQLRFTHEGLTPEIECYDSCSTAWNMYLHEKLLALISTQSVSAA